MFVSVRSTHNQNVLEWITPPVNYVSMEVWVNPGPTCPADEGAASAGTLLSLPSPMPANANFLVTDPFLYAPGADLCYSFFIERDSGPIQPGFGPSQEIVAHTLEAAPGPAKWTSNLADVTALAQVGIGAQNVIAVANEGGVYGLGRGPGGGFWSSGYWPFRTDFLPIQGRPGVLTLPVKGSTHTTFVGSQDGRVYAFDADRGARAGGALWYTSPALGTAVQSGIAGMFTFFGGVGDHLFVGTRPSPGRGAVLRSRSVHRGAENGKPLHRGRLLDRKRQHDRIRGLHSQPGLLRKPRVHARDEPVTLVPQAHSRGLWSPLLAPQNTSRRHQRWACRAERNGLRWG